MVNPYIICTWVFFLSLLYPLHGITTFPLNILCFGGITGTNFNELSYKTFYSVFSHIGPFLWVPWTITIESIILCLATFYLYTLFMTILFKNPLDYYIEEVSNGRREFVVNLVVLIKYSALPITLFFLYLIYYLSKK